MNFPDTITVLRPTGTDAYGNEGTNYDAAAEHTEKCFEVVQGTLLLLPPTADVLKGDRYRLGDDTYAGEPALIRSPSAAKLWQIPISRVED